MTLAELKRANALLIALETAEAMQVEAGKRDLHFELQLGELNCFDDGASVGTANLYFLLEKPLALEVLDFVIAKLEKDLEALGIKR